MTTHARSILLLALAALVGSVAPTRADFKVEVFDNGSDSSSTQGFGDDYADFTFDFDTVSPGTVPFAFGSTTLMLSQYTDANIKVKDQTKFQQIGAQLDYDIQIIITDTVMGDLGTIDIGGKGIGATATDDVAMITPTASLTTQVNSAMLDGNSLSTFSYTRTIGTNIYTFSFSDNSQDAANINLPNVNDAEFNGRFRGFLLNVTVTSTIPEPATLTSLGIGGLIFAARAGLRRKKVHTAV